MASVLGGSGADTVTGTVERDYIAAAGGNDVVDGGAGDDWMEGGAGADTFILKPGDGWDCIGDFKAAEGDRLDLRGWSAIRSLADLTIQTDGADSILVFSPTDSVRLVGVAAGSLGPDSVLFAGGTSGGGGDDTGSGGGSGHTLTGTAERDVLIGTAGGDVFVAGAGLDYLEGGGGSDRFVLRPGDSWDCIQDFQAGAGGDVLDLRAWSNLYSLADVTVRSDSDGISLVFGPNDGIRLNGVSAAALTGANFLFADGRVPGGEGDDTLVGGAGNETLDGGAGADLMSGGRGNDLYRVDNPNDRVVEAPGEGTDRVEASVSWTLGDNVESLVLTGTAALDGTGNALGNGIDGNDAANRLAGLAGNDRLSGHGGDDHLDGGDGADTLDGGSGADTMTGGAGNDLYHVDDEGDRIVEGPGGGTDSVWSWVDHRLAANVENLVLQAADGHRLEGNALGNRITGNGGDDTLAGGGGNDSLIGGAGTDTALFLGKRSDYEILVRDSGSVTVRDLAPGVDGDDGTDTLTGIERLAFQDTVIDTPAPPPWSIQLTAGLAPDSLVASFVSGNALDSRRMTVNWGDGSPVSNSYAKAGEERAHVYAPLGAANRYAASVTMQTPTGSVFERFDVQFAHSPTATAMTRVSTAADGTQGDDKSYDPRLSGDGRHVVFRSAATNLVAGDTNGVDDIFVKDLQTGSIVRASTGSDGAQADAGSSYASLSGDGRYVYFTSQATNFDNTRPYVYHVYRKDLQTGALLRLDAPAGTDSMIGGSDYASASADGRFVAFETSSRLAPGDTNWTQDAVVKDMVTGAVILASSTADGQVTNLYNAVPTISADGRHVVFVGHASDLLPDDTNGVSDIFVKDLQTGSIVRASTAADGTQANGVSWGFPSLSADGRYVAFTSEAGNLVAGDTNQSADVFVKDLQTGSIVRASAAVGGVEPVGGSGSAGPVLSRDGRYVAFGSPRGLVPDDRNGRSDVYVRDLQTGELTWVSALADRRPNGDGFSISFSDDASRLVIASEATNLAAGDTNGAADIFVVDWKPQPSILTGGDGRDVLVGNSGRDTLIGGAGADALSGSWGDDRLDGGQGDDLLEGGGGADLFVFGLGSGRDVITDFDASQGDRIGLASGLSYRLDQTAAGEALIVFGASDSLTLRGIQPGAVSGGWFTIA